ncbi:GNAT family N-acetyltransferase [Streptomyces longispororuber]|uniref:GNAT family N-acetyltransferase n=1 Tax=Streptomyces longispororuber TaxID=68230 RepID=UPI0033DB19DB
MAAAVHRLAGRDLLAHGAGIRAVHAAAFGREPWHSLPADADRYLERLARDVTRPGFTAALALDGERVLGFATAWTSSTPLPADRAYPRVTAALGAERTAAWLCGGREVDELAVLPDTHGLGLGRTLLAAVTRDAPDGRCWLLTSADAAAVRFYERLGWWQATRPAPDGNGIVVLLGPDHPARAAAAPPQ